MFLRLQPVTIFAFSRGLSRSWTVLLPSDTHRKPITSITAVLLPFVTYLLNLSLVETSIFYRTIKLQSKNLTITRAIRNSSGTAMNPWNWLNITQFSWYGCRVMAVLKIMKRPINWQNWDLNIRLLDLNQLAACQQKLARRLSGTGQRR
jgi:hypothetical protein